MVGLAVRAAKDGDNESMLPITPPTLDETGDIYAGVSAYGSDAMLAALDSVFKAAEAFGQRARMEHRSPSSKLCSRRSGSRRGRSAMQPAPT